MSFHVHLYFLLISILLLPYILLILLYFSF
nr:MAG TPA: hypothetical protein [Caudoviricetes sp.]